MKVLVTGGAGYIGSVTVEKLLDEGHEVLVIDNLSTGNRNAVHPSAQFVNCNLKNQRDLLSSTIKEFKPGAVIHLAANSLVGESVTDPFKYIDDNVNNALNLIKECIDNTIPKFILSSTANIFGNSNNLIDEIEVPKIISNIEKSLKLPKKLSGLRKLFGGDPGYLKEII